MNGIRSVLKRNKLQEFIESCEVVQFSHTDNPLILCLNESKVDDETMKREHLQEQLPREYMQYWNCCKPPMKGYSGTVVLTKVRPLNVTYDLGV